MSNKSIYQQQAELNEEIAAAAQLGFPEWAIIMYFYAALHWINDYAYRNGEMEELKKNADESQHKTRREYIKKVAKRKKRRELEECYKTLFSDSIIARYLEDEQGGCINSTARQYYSKCNIKDYIDCLETIKKILAS
ncbi:MAG TPA: hypothetical protein VK184_18035 [Nostocaceae cyanobacterium]|nr:hypothetical protein [Nostocaceae cyanobacterium]